MSRRAGADDPAGLLFLVLGGSRRTGPALQELERHGVEAVRSDPVLDWLSPAALASRLAPELERARASLQPAHGGR